MTHTEVHCTQYSVHRTSLTDYTPVWSYFFITMDKINVIYTFSYAIILLHLQDLTCNGSPFKIKYLTLKTYLGVILGF